MAWGVRTSTYRGGQASWRRCLCVVPPTGRPALLAYPLTARVAATSAFYLDTPFTADIIIWAPLGTKGDICVGSWSQ